MYKQIEYFSPQLMGSYDGRVIGSSNLAVQNIFEPPNPSVICNIKQPGSAPGNNPALFFDLKQGEGITIACNIIKNQNKNSGSTTLNKSFIKPKNCKNCCY
jgi:hypothetical protein